MPFALSLADVELWDVIAELVLVCTSPPPTNPFAVDLDYFDSLPVPERLLASAAMMNFLLCVLNSGSRPYNNKSNIDCTARFKAFANHLSFYSAV